ncbi:MAG: sensor histidine kinase, partial [Clostridia bacterium]|nr:sensor histidine kinase [Clostridia bacterium]
SRPNEKKPTTFSRLVLKLSIRNTLVPVLVFVSVFLLVYAAFSQHILARRNRDVCEGDSARLSGICRSYTGYLKSLAGSDLIDGILSGGEPAGSIYSDFYDFLSEQDYRGTFYLLDESRSIVVSLNSGEGNTNERSVQRLASRCEQNDYAITSEKTTISISFTSSERSRAYTVCVPVLKDGSAEGYLAYRFYEKGLLDFLNASGTHGYVLTDRNGGIIASNMDTGEDALDRFLPDSAEDGLCRLRGADYYLASAAVAGTDLKLYMLSPEVRFLNLQVLLMAGLMLGALALSYLAYSRSLAMRITEPVDQLLEAIQQLKTGDFTPTESLTNLEEFRQLFDEYNGAIEQLDKLMETQQSLKIRQLEAQFNPHFLYNVLETLRYTIATDTEAAQDIVLRLSHLMRYAASPVEREVPLGEDLVYIEDYLALQKQRFLDRLTYRLEAEKDAKDARVFRLLLQPLIENAIKYGYVARRDITVDVRCRIEGGDLVMTVEDNGGGMSEERLRQVQQALDEGVNGTGSLGLFNTHQLIRLKYGAPYGLTLENRAGEGLTVICRMPARR